MPAGPSRGSPHSPPRVWPSRACSGRAAAGGLAALGQRLEHQVQVGVHAAINAGIHLHVNAGYGPGHDQRAAPSRRRRRSAVLAGAGLPGLVDVHVHFLPERVQAKVWQYFGRPAPTTAPPGRRLPAAGPGAAGGPGPARRARVLDVAVPAQARAWRPGSTTGRRSSPRACRRSCGRRRFYPEPEAPVYVAEALDRGVRIFKVHAQVGAVRPAPSLLDPVWARLAETGTPVVIHCGSGRWPASTPAPSRSPACWSGTRGCNS